MVKKLYIEYRELRNKMKDNTDCKQQQETPPPTTPYKIKDISLSPSPNSNSNRITTRSKSRKHIRQLIIDGSFDDKIERIKIIQNDKHHIYSMHDTVAPIFKLNDDGDNNNDDLKVITKQFSDTIAQKEHHILCLTEDKKKLEAQNKKIKRKMKKLKKNDDDEQNKSEIDKLKKKIVTVSDKLKLAQQQIRRQKKRIDRFKKKNKNNLRARKQFDSLSRMQTYRRRSNMQQYLKDMHCNDKKQIGRSLSFVCSKDKENEIAEELADNRKIKKVTTVYINQYAKSVKNDDEIILNQTITKYLSKVSERQWDDIRFGVHTHREVVIIGLSLCFLFNLR